MFPRKTVEWQKPACHPISAHTACNKKLFYSAGLIHSPHERSTAVPRAVMQLLTGLAKN
jgi:hypothetical protein